MLRQYLPRGCAVAVSCALGLSACGQGEDTQGERTTTTEEETAGPTHRADDATLRLRPPFAGLARMPSRPGLEAVVFVALGSTTYDGLTRTQLWLDLTADFSGHTVLEGQATIALASDPLGRGWDLFGTAGRTIDFTVVSPLTVAYLQCGAIVAGHVAGVVLAHDRALALFDQRLATRSQYPALVAMVLFTVGGLLLLLGG